MAETSSGGQGGSDGDGDGDGGEEEGRQESEFLPEGTPATAAYAKPAVVAVVTAILASRGVFREGPGHGGEGRRKGGGEGGRVDSISAYQ